jgi:hypothetical protein
LNRTITGLGAVAGHIAHVADELADGLRASHIRVREAVGQRARRRIEVAAQHPADILGVYVYLPEVDA